MKSYYGLVFFATGWGPTKGGINSFNYDLCKALGDLSSSRSISVFCLCPGITSEDEKKCAELHHVKLLDVKLEDFNNYNFNKIITENILSQCENIFWIGHDIITGEQACHCRDDFKKDISSKAVIFHHMNYNEYYAIGKPDRAARGEEKVKAQKDIFKSADFAIAVGPKLFESLKDILTTTDSDYPIMEVIPGLADIKPIKKETHKKTVLFTGRLEKDNDPIKQYSLPLYAVGDLIKNKDASFEEIELKMFGLDSETHSDILAKVEELQNEANRRAGAAIAIKPLEYTSDRETLFNVVRESSIVVMPSLSEGFGLSGFESVAAGVPIIISRNSGLCKFLESLNLSDYFEKVEVQGNIETNVTNEQDIKNAYLKFKAILKNYKDYKEKALKLRSILIEKGYTWKTTAITILDFLQIIKTNDYVKCLIDFVDLKVLDEFKNSAFSIANEVVIKFVKKISKEFNVDEADIISLRVNSIYNVPSEIIALIEEKNEKHRTYNRMKCFYNYCVELVSDFFSQLIKLLKISTNNIHILSNYIKVPSQNLVKKDFLITIRDYSEYIFGYKNNYMKNVYKEILKARVESVLSIDDKMAIAQFHDNLIKKYNVLNFEGLSVMVSAGAQNIPLDRVYATMELKSQKSESLFDLTENDDLETFRLNNSKRLIIKGDPGSGKSTYLKKRLISCCESNKNSLNVFFKVSNFSKWLSEKKDAKDLDLLSGYLKEEVLNVRINNILLYNIYDKLVEVGGVVYHIDGLDEVQDTEQKKKINQIITAFVEETKDCEFIITSRKVGLDEELYKTMGFDIREIAPLSKDSIIDYIYKWYKIVGKLPSESEQDCDRFAKKLALSITSDNNIKLLNLAGNPLLLSIIVILHYHGINPPTNRTKLYEEITKTLLETWIEKKNFERKYQTEYLTNFFSRVAFEIVTNDYNTMTIPESKLKEMYRNYLTERNYIDEEGVDKFIQYISDAAGIFPCQGILNGENLYGFLMHRQITEYYAAIALENKLNCQNISFSSIINESKWTEVSILMGGNMSLQGEAGQNRVNTFIKKLINTKSKPIEDFKNNIKLVLKWIANSAYINRDNLELLIENLKQIFKSTNSYRVLHFCEDIIAVLDNDQCKKQFSDFINNMLNEENCYVIKNICVIINMLLKKREYYANALAGIDEDKIIKSLNLLVTDNDFDNLFREKGCYHNIFMDYYTKCVNKYYVDKMDNEEKEKWHRYTRTFASANKHLYMYRHHDAGKALIYFFKNLETEKDVFKNKQIFDEYIQMIVLYFIAFDIAENKKIIDKDNEIYRLSDKWDFRNLINSAKKISEDTEYVIGRSAITYVSSGIKIAHYRNENAHELIIYAYDNINKSIRKDRILIENDFSLDNINDQLKKKNISLSAYHCLNLLSDLTIDEKKKSEMFECAYDNHLLLSKEDWHQAFIKKIAQDGNVFYDSYDNIKRYIEFSPTRTNPNILKKEFKTYYKFFAKQRKNISVKEKKWLVKLYKEEENEKHKNVIYDILYDLFNSENMN